MLATMVACMLISENYEYFSGSLHLSKHSLSSKTISHPPEVADVITMHEMLTNQILLFHF